MSPVPRRDRLGEYLVKGLHLGLREVGQAPEHVRARRLAAQAAASSGTTPDGPRILILTPRDWAVHVQWEGLMAQALRIRGAHVSFLTCGGGLELCDRVNTYEGPPMPCHTCTRYVNASIDAHGFPRRSLRDGWSYRPQSEWPELDALELSELFDVMYQGMPLGRLIRIPVRWFLLRSALDDEPRAAITARRFLRAAKDVLDGLNVALDRTRPDALVVLNGLFFFESIAVELARQRAIPTVCYERGFIPGTILMHSDSPDNLYDISKWWQDACKSPLTHAEERRLDIYLEDRRLGRRTMDQYWTKDTKHDGAVRTQGGRLAVLFTNLTWDSAVLGQEVAFPSIHAWIVAAVEWFAARPEHRLILRIHPAEVKLAGKETREPLGDFVRARFPTLPRNIEVVEPSDPTSSYALMNSCDLGLVFTSTAGLELALLGKPVIVAGATHYRGKGFTIDPATPVDFAVDLTRVIDDPVGSAPDRDLARRYANVFFFVAPMTIPGVEEHVPGLARLSLGSLSDLSPGVHADVDRFCAVVLGNARPQPKSGGPRLETRRAEDGPG